MTVTLTERVNGLSRISMYSAVWNSLNYPCCIFPVTSVDPVKDPVQPRTEYLGKADRLNWETCECRPFPCVSCMWMLKVVATPDHPETFEKAPVGLQLVGQTLEEEAVLAMTEIVDAALKGYGIVTKAKL